jgi:hypothetical protein
MKTLLRSATLFVSLFVAGSAFGQPAPWPTRAWPTSTANDQKLLSALLEEFDRKIYEKKLGYVDRLVVIANGYKIIDERYENDYRAISRQRRTPIGCGTDACAGWTGDPEFNYLDPDRHPFYRGRDIHTLQSVTKSVTSALIGVAIQRKEIRGVDAPLLSLLAGYDGSRVDPRLRRATLADLLTMRTGIEWHEQDRPLDSTNTTIQLEASRDWVQFTLSQPMDAEPGTKWVYNSGTSHMMSAILRNATGMTADKYAEAHLFGPLGIRDYHWKREPRGLPDTEGGLYLDAEQLAKIGYLYLNDGVWDGKRLLPEGWVKASTARHVDRANAAGYGYGYQWWRLDRRNTEIWAALGFGGQFLLVLPAQRIVAVINSWSVWGDGRAMPVAALADVLIDAVRF